MTLVICFGVAFSRAAERAGSSSNIGNSTSANPSSLSGSPGQNSRSAVTSPVSVVTDPAYKLSVGDQIAVQIYEEPDLDCNQLIDNKGVARITEIGETKLTGLTVREAEYLIEKLYKEREILKRPAVKLTVVGFSPREVLVLGGVLAPGAIPFAQDAVDMPIVMAILRAGGFKPGAKQNAVTVRRKDADGRDLPVITVNVEAMMSTRPKRPDQASQSFAVYPGDIVNVEMSIF